MTTTHHSNNPQTPATPDVLAIHDISCVGKCSMTVALPILSALGVECRPLPTALLSTHTGGFTGYTYLDLTAEMRKILTAWQPLQLHFDAIYSGFMASAEQIDLLQDIIQTYPALSVIDPVMADDGALYPVFDNAFVAKMTELIPIADVLTPNITEACLLTDTPYPPDPAQRDEAFITTLVKKLQDKGATNIVLTGVSFTPGQIGAAAVTADGRTTYHFAAEIAGAYHGTGDIFGSVLTAHLLKPTHPVATSAAAFVEPTHPVATSTATSVEPNPPVATSTAASVEPTHPVAASTTAPVEPTPTVAASTALIMPDSLAAATRAAVDFVVAAIAATPPNADKKYGVAFEAALAGL